MLNLATLSPKLMEIRRMLVEPREERSTRMQKVLSGGRYFHRAMEMRFCH